MGYETTFPSQRYREVSVAFDEAFHAALRAVAERTPDLTLREFGPLSCPHLMWADDPTGSYAIGCGIVDYSFTGMPEALWPTFLWLSYTAEGSLDPFDGMHAMDLGRFCDSSSRDAEMLAELVVAGAAVARRRRNAFFARLTPGDCRREGLTPDGEELIVDCEAHGTIGRVPAGGDEFGAGERLFAEHLAAQGGT